MTDTIQNIQKKFEKQSILIKEKKIMKRIKNVIVSVVTCVVSTCLIMFGVYAATNPSVSISGQVSYSVTDAKLLVQGKLAGAGDVENGTYPEAATTYTSSTRVIDQNNRYLDFTTGGSTGNNSDNLESWKLGDLNFEETAGGINPIVAWLKITNYSPYNVKATITMASDLENVSRVIKKGSKAMTETSTRTYQLILPAFETTAKSTEISVEYSVVDDSKKVEKQNINFDVKFEWTNEQPTQTVSVDDIIANNGIVTMGRAQIWTEHPAEYEWNVDEDGFVLNLDGTKLQTNDGENVKVKGYDADSSDWIYETESGEKLSLMLDPSYNSGEAEFRLEIGGAIVVDDIDLRILMPTKDMQWMAYAYKNASGEVKKVQYDVSYLGERNRAYTLTENSIQELNGAVTVYFANYWNIPLSLYGQVYLATEKIAKDSSSRCMHNDIAGATVLAGDYYYSDIRQKIRNADSELIQALNIDTNNALFRNIQTRTINDLYKNNCQTENGTFSDQTLPYGADGTQEDTFWVLSVSEFEMCSDSYPICLETTSSHTWTRTLDENQGTAIFHDNYHAGNFGNDRVPDYTFVYDGSETIYLKCGPRIGFELALD